jgi:hypothetical protein
MEQQKLDRLPKWARFLIEKLTTNVKYWRNKALSTANCGKDSNVVLRLYSDEDRGLPTDATIAFKLKDDNEIEVWVREGALYFYGRTGRIAFYPNSANTGFITVKRG